MSPVLGYAWWFGWPAMRSDRSHSQYGLMSCTWGLKTLPVSVSTLAGGSALGTELETTININGCISDNLMLVRKPHLGSLLPLGDSQETHILASILELTLTFPCASFLLSLIRAKEKYVCDCSHVPRTILIFLLIIIDIGHKKTRDQAMNARQKWKGRLQYVVRARKSRRQH